jgi:hypothetical protein
MKRNGKNIRNQGIYNGEVCCFPDMEFGASGLKFFLNAKDAKDAKKNAN